MIWIILVEMLTRTVTNQIASRFPTSTEAVVPCQYKIILKNFRPEPPPTVDRPKIILFQHGTKSKIILKNFTLFRCFILTWNHV